MYHLYGIVLLKGVNCSFNRCTRDAACYSQNTASTTAYPVTCSLSFCSFANNNATQFRIIYLNNYSGNKEIKSCNIVDNSHEADSSSNGIIYINGPCEIKDSCITGNKATYTFYESHSSSTITVSYCTLDPDVDSKKSSYVTITNKATSSFTVPLFHLNTDKCKAEFIKAGKRSSNFCHTQGGSYFMILVRKKDILKMTTLIFITSFLTSAHSSNAI